jgi:hypothetical protein
MSKLTDTQLVILSTAGQRDDGAPEKPVPDTDEPNSVAQPDEVLASA